MPWNPLVITGTNSVRANKTPLNENSAYATNKLVLDHYWNQDGNKDGYHKQINMPVLAADPTTLPTSIDGQIYYRLKTAIQSPGATQNKEPFYYTQSTGSINQYLQIGMRCMAAWEQTTPIAQPTQAQILYSHNLLIQDVGTPANSGVYRVSEGIYVLKFAISLPSTNYIVSGMARRGDVTSGGSSALVVDINGSTNATRAANMAIDSVTLNFSSSTTGALRDPGYAMITIVGG